MNFGGPLIFLYILFVLLFPRDNTPPVIVIKSAIIVSALSHLSKGAYLAGNVYPFAVAIYILVNLCARLKPLYALGFLVLKGILLFSNSLHSAALRICTQLVILLTILNFAYYCSSFDDPTDGRVMLSRSLGAFFTLISYTSSMTATFKGIQLISILNSPSRAMSLGLLYNLLYVSASALSLFLLGSRGLFISPFLVIVFINASAILRSISRGASLLIRKARLNIVSLITIFSLLMMLVLVLVSIYYYSYVRGTGNTLELLYRWDGFENYAFYSQFQNSCKFDYLSSLATTFLPRAFAPKGPILAEQLWSCRLVFDGEIVSAALSRFSSTYLIEYFNPVGFVLNLFSSAVVMNLFRSYYQIDDYRLRVYLLFLSIALPDFLYVGFSSYLGQLLVVISLSALLAVFALGRSDLKIS